MLIDLNISDNKRNVHKRPGSLPFEDLDVKYSGKDEC